MTEGTKSVEEHLLKELVAYMGDQLPSHVKLSIEKKEVNVMYACVTDENYYHHGYAAVISGPTYKLSTRPYQAKELIDSNFTIKLDGLAQDVKDLINQMQDTERLANLFWT